MIVRLAFRLATSRSPEHRWRQLAVPLASSISVILVLFGSGLLAANRRQEERLLERTPILAEVPSDADVLLQPRADVVNGDQYLTIWLAAPLEGNPPVPPGLPRLPTPGEAFVSPRLAQVLAEDVDFARRYPLWTQIGSDGLVASDELIAYVGLPRDRVNERTHHIVAFGRPSGSQRGLVLGLSDLPRSSQMVTGVVIFAFLPGLILLYLGASANSVLRDHRFQILTWLGAPRGTLVKVAVAEVLSLAAPGVALGLVTWLALAPKVGPMPFVWMDPLKGDLVLPWWVALLDSVAILAITSTLAAAGPLAIGRRPDLRPRPSLGRARLQDYRLYPLGIAALILLARPWVSEARADGLLVAAMVLMLVGVPLVAPLVVRQVGVHLAHIHTVPTLLAGSRLGWDPIRNARPHIAAATLVALTLTVLGYQKLTNAEIRSGHAPPVALVTVNINVATADEIGQLASELRPAVVAVFREDANRWIVGANCQEISRHIAGMGCDQNSPADFDSTGELRMSQALGLPSQLDLVLAPDLRLGTEWHEHTGSESATHEHAPSDLSQTSHFHDGLLVIDSTTSPADLEQSVGTLTTTALPGSSVLGVSRFRRYYPPSWSWTVAGLAMAAAVLTLGTILPIMDRLTSTRAQRRHLLKIGVTERRLRFLEALLFGIPFAAVIGVGVTAGITSCWLLVSQAHPPGPMPWASIVAVLMAATIPGTAASLVVALGIVGSSTSGQAE